MLGIPAGWGFAVGLGDGPLVEVLRKVMWVEGERCLPTWLTGTVCSWLAKEVDIVGAALTLGPREGSWGVGKGRQMTGRQRGSLKPPLFITSPGGTSGGQFHLVLQWLGGSAAQLLLAVAPP